MERAPTIIVHTFLFFLLVVQDFTRLTYRIYRTRRNQSLDH